MPRKIVYTPSNESTALPKGFKWQKAYRKAVGSPLGSDEYVVSYPVQGGVNTDFCSTLTAARKLALSTVKTGYAWAEICRWAENTCSVRKVCIGEYSVPLETGDEVA